MAAGELWPTDLGPDLSRGCRALKTWFVLRACGVSAIGAGIDNGLDMAALLILQIEAAPDLERLGPADLNIVCFRYTGGDRFAGDLDELNRRLVQELQMRGCVAPSLTRIGGKVAIRAALFNPRTGVEEITALVDGARQLGAELAGEVGS